MNKTATGREKSSVRAASCRILPVSFRSASRYAHAPSGVLVNSARACASTIGSLSTYTILESGATDCATSWVLFAEGMPVPMSRNWRIPASPARKRTTRPRNSRLARMSRIIVGRTAMTSWAAILSGSKWSLPPSQ